MKRAITMLPALCALLFLGACAAQRHVRVAPLFADDAHWAQVAPKDESAVLVTEGDLQRKYRSIARIFVESVGRDKNLSFARMRQEAAKIGADAVIQIKVSTQYEGQNVNLYTGQNLGPRNRHTLEGLAVVYERN
jgi:uncharacterized protein YbjQ (UPF0145 family)